MGREDGVLNTLAKFREESGMDEQFDLRALQAVGRVVGDRRILRIWFNDGRIRELDCTEMCQSGKGRFALLQDGDVFVRSATVWDGAPGFDFGGHHAQEDCLDLDPYQAWVDAVDVTRQVLAEEEERGREALANIGFAAEPERPYGKK